MRIDEILTELLTTVSPWKLTRDDTVNREYLWSVADAHYRLKATAENETQEDEYFRWDVSFELLSNANQTSNGSFNTTGTGNELAVFSTVIDIIMNDIIPVVEPAAISFIADGTGNRVSLYTRLITRNLPDDYSVNTTPLTDLDGSDIEFYIKKDDYSESN